MPDNLQQQFHQLIKDTLAFIAPPKKIERLQKIVQKPSVVKAPPLQVPKASASAPVSTPVSTSAKQVIAKEVVKVELSPFLLFEKIQRHLPHLSLIKEIPPIATLRPSFQVAILVSHKEDLPFLKNLAQAIQARSCLVKLIDLEKLERENSLNTFFSKQSFQLILSQKKELPLPPTSYIVLASIDAYQKNTELKKQLWSSICQSLKIASPKSS